MAAARKIKTLLTVNILVFVGIVLFSVYCRIQDRSEELVQLGRSAEARARTRHGKVTDTDRQSILQRLERLEDVVYNQLNGVSKAMGLLEGPGGLGQGGAAATLGGESPEGGGKYEEYGYNAQLSERISLDRNIPDYRPKTFFYVLQNPGVDFGDVSERVALRNRLKCKSFHWYLQHVYPEMRIYNNTITYGEVRNSKASGYCLDQGSEDDNRAILYPCHGMSSQLARYSTEGLLQLGPLGSTTFLPDTKCLIDDGRGRIPSLKKCDAVSRSSQKLWDFTQNGPIINRDTGRCLEVEMSKEASFGLRLVMQRCSGQKWMIRNWIKHPRH